MARAGRKRAAGPREANGRLQRTHGQHRLLAELAPQLEAQARSMGYELPRRGSNAYFALLNSLRQSGSGPTADAQRRGLITKVQADAAEAFFRCRAYYLRALEAPKAQAKAVDHLNAMASSHSDSSSLSMTDEDAEKLVRDQKRYLRAERVLMDAGRGSHRAVMAFLSGVQPVAREELLVGLNALAVHFGLKGRTSEKKCLTNGTKQVQS